MSSVIPDSPQEFESPSSMLDVAVEGGRWGAARSLALQMFTVVSTMVLARILSPAEFGLVAAATVVVTMFSLITRFGFGTSLIRRDKLDTDEISTIFWVATGVGLAATALASAFAAPLAALIGQPSATPMIITLATLIPLRLGGNVGRSLLIRELRFRRSAILEVVEVAIYLIVAIGLAVFGLGAWAIVIGQVAKTLFYVFANLLSVEWSPSLRFRRQFLRDEIRFSGGLFGYSSLNYLQTNTDYWIVSAVLGAEALGAYYIAYVIPNLIRRRFTGIAQEVLYPIMAKVVDDIERARSVYLRAIQFVGFVSIPALIGISVLSDIVIALAFGDRWDAAAGPLAVLSISAAIMAVTIPGGYSIALAFDRPYLLLPGRVAGVLVLGIGLLIAAPSGDLTTVSVAVLGSALVTAAVKHSITGRLIGLSLGQFLFRMLPTLVSTAVMAALLTVLKEPLTTRLVLPAAAAILIALGATIYFVASWLLARNHFKEQIRYARLILRPKERAGG